MVVRFGSALGSYNSGLYFIPVFVKTGEILVSVTDCVFITELYVYWATIGIVSGREDVEVKVVVVDFAFVLDDVGILTTGFAIFGAGACEVSGTREVRDTESDTGGEIDIGGIVRRLDVVMASCRQSKEESRLQVG